MKIGLPRALMYYYYYPLWKKLFEELGAEIVISDVTNGLLISQGIQASVSELCVPIKVFIAHLINLLEKGVDYCFVPQFISVGAGEWFCPKFIGLPVLAEYSIPEIRERLLIIEIDGSQEDTCEIRNYLPLCDVLSVTKRQLKMALRSAHKYFKEFRNTLIKGYTIEEAELVLEGREIDIAYKNSNITIGVLGYVYNVYDKFVSMNILARLRNSNVNIITFEMISEDDLKNLDDVNEKPLFWIFARKIYNAGKKLAENNSVHGIIHVTAFACGPDSIIGKMLETVSERTGVPFMTIRVDEHSGENHVQTRVEAFCDMLKKKSR